MNFPRIKKSETPLTILNAYMSSKSRSVSHYDTLKVSQDATQEEIKSAYYKLTKQYHPDVNKTAEAKDKFRDISDAYQVLGNYKIRRQYDKGMIARGMAMKSTKKDDKEPKHMAFYKSRMASYPKPIVTADTKIYDFDAWTRAHYGDTLRRTIHRKQTNIELEKNKVNYAESKLQSSSELSTYITMTVIFILATMFAVTKDNYDIPLEQNKKDTKR